MSQEAEDKTLEQKEDLVAFLPHQKKKVYVYVSFAFSGYQDNKCSLLRSWKIKKKKKHSTFRKLFNQRFVEFQFSLCLCSFCPLYDFSVYF